MILMDYIVIILLIITIIFCWVLNNKIIRLNNSRGELAKIFKNFETSINSASEIIEDIETTSQREFLGLDKKIEIAHRAIRELDGLHQVSKEQLQTLDRAINQANLYKNYHDTQYNKHQTTPSSSSIPNSVSHRVHNPHNASGIEMIAAKTIPVYSANSTDEKRAAIESLLEKISRVKKGNN